MLFSREITPMHILFTTISPRETTGQCYSAHIRLVLRYAKQTVGAVGHSPVKIAHMIHIIALACTIMIIINIMVHASQYGCAFLHTLTNLCLPVTCDSHSVALSLVGRNAWGLIYNCLFDVEA